MTPPRAAQPLLVTDAEPDVVVVGLDDLVDAPELATGSGVIALDQDTKPARLVIRTDDRLGVRRG